MTTAVKYPNVRVRLVGEDGNAYAIMGRVESAMRRAGIERSEIDAYTEAAMSGDYNNLLRVTTATVDCSGGADIDTDTAEDAEECGTCGETWNTYDIIDGLCPDCLYEDDEDDEEEYA